MSLRKCCGNCGAFIPTGFNFCPGCGAKQTVSGYQQNNATSESYDDFDFDYDYEDPDFEYVDRNKNDASRISPRVKSTNNRRYNGVQNFDSKKKGKVWPLILGIAALLFCWSPLGFILGIVAIIVSANTMKKEGGKTGRSVAGMVLGCVALTCSIVAIGTSNQSDNKADTSTDNKLEESVLDEVESEIETEQEEIATVSEDNSEKEETQAGLTKEEIISKCKPLVYKDIARNPDSYVGQYFTVDLRVSMVQEGGFLDGYKKAYRCYTKSDYGWFGDYIILTDNREEKSAGYVKILEDDVIRVYGRFDNMMPVKNVLNGAKSEEVCLEVLYADVLDENGTELSINEVEDAIFGEGHLYDNASVRDMMNGSRTEKIGEYAIIKANSDECTEEALADVYYNYFLTHNFNWMAIIYSDKTDGTGVYFNAGIISVNDKLEEDQYGDYSVISSEDSTLYGPSGDGTSIYKIEF